uniref:Uncharacterized protein n=1 Tax=Rhizophora mucronata TaxID=61149 RepID=A0A2P2Q4X1_RHIMU
MCLEFMLCSHHTNDKDMTVVFTVFFGVERYIRALFG